MPPVPKVPHDTLKSLILNLADGVISDSGKVAPPTAAVWQQLCDLVEGKLLPKYLYTYVKMNRHGMYDELLACRNITFTEICDEEVPEVLRVDSESDECLAETTTSTDTDHVEAVRPLKNFTILIPPNDWIAMKPKPATYRRRDRRTCTTEFALPGYSYEALLTKHFWDQHKLPCAYSFRRSRVSIAENREQYIKIEALCKECGATAVGRILSEPVDGESVLMEWRANDTRGIRHKKRRHLRGEERRTVGLALAKDSCARYQREAAEKTMSHADPEPPNLWGNDVLRQVKKETLDSALSLGKGTDPVQNLQRMKHKEPFAGSIHEIGADKFYVHCQTQSQKEVYRAHRSSGYVTLCIDATGSLVERLPRPHGTSGHIFLYEAVIHTGTVQLPVFQMLSEKNDANSILFWINEWIRSGAKPPHEVVIDNSPALKAAIARSFCECPSLQALKNQCFQFLRGKSDRLPPCFLRLDVAHIMNSAKKWNVWQDKSHRRLREFYLHCLGLLVQAASLEEFEQILRHVLTVAMSPDEGFSETGEEVPMEDSRRYLADLIKVSPARTSDCNLNKGHDGDIHLPDDDDSAFPAEETFDDVKSWLLNIKMEVENDVKEISGDRPSAYFSMKIAEEFIRLAQDFPFWSAVLVTAYKSHSITASSSLVESDFKNLKKSELQGITKPMRVDKFVAIHFHSIEGKSRLASASKNDPRIIRAGEKRLIKRKERNQDKEQSGESEEETLEESVIRQVRFRKDDGKVFEEPRQKERQEERQVDLRNEDNEEMEKQERRQQVRHQSKKRHVDWRKGSDEESEEEKPGQDIGQPEEKHVDRRKEDDGEAETSTADMSGSELPEDFEDNMHGRWHAKTSDNRLGNKVDLEADDLNEIENWRGKGHPSRGRRPKRNSKLDANPDLDAAVKAGEVKTPKHRNLKNCNLCPPISLGPTSRVLVVNTCPFDALCHAIATAYIESEEFRKSVDASDNLLMKTSRNVAVQGAVSSTYKMRAEALATVLDPVTALSWPTTSTRNVSRQSIVTTKFDCFSNAATVASKLLEDAPSTKIVRSCLKCSATEKRQEAVAEINMKLLFERRTGNLSDVIQDSLKERYSRNCVKCGCEVTPDIEISPHFLINVDFLSDERLRDMLFVNPSNNRSYALKEIPKTIQIFSANFTLYGVVAYISHHYVTYARRSKARWEVFDDLAKGVISVTEEEVMKPHVLVYTL